MAKNKSKRTKDVSKLSAIFFWLSFCCYFGVGIFSIIAIFSHLGGTKEQGMEIISEQLKTMLVSFSVTMLIVIALAIFIKNKARTTIYMFALVINGLIFKEVGMYAILAIWGLDEFLFNMLHKHYLRLKIINREIDRRV